ncbi:TetR/AcrR family transcriptional regulator C-terminal domain-containing protein [Glycomyces halotolerans]
MAARGGSESQQRLSRERVLRSAVAIADEGGIGALTMRSLASALGVEAMSLYHHVANKEAVLDGLVEVIMVEIERAVAAVEGPSPESDWKGALRARVLAARSVMLRHRWAPGVFETRRGTHLAVVRYFDGLVGLMRSGGLSFDLIHHAMHALGSRALGFSQELFQPESGQEDAAGEEMAAIAEQVPNLAAMLGEVAHEDPDSTLGWCDDQFEFEFGLDLMLDGLERLHEAD